MGKKWIDDNLTKLTSSQIDKLASDSTVLGESEKSNLKNKWKEEIKNELRTKGHTFDYAAYMENRPAKDVAALPPEVLTNVKAVPYISEAVLQQIATSSISTTDRDKIKRNIETQHSAGHPAIGHGYFKTTNNHFKNNW
jgi:hypothetical protein